MRAREYRIVGYIVLGVEYMDINSEFEPTWGHSDRGYKG